MGVNKSSQPGRERTGQAEEAAVYAGGWPLKNPPLPRRNASSVVAFRMPLGRPFP